MVLISRAQSSPTPRSWWSARTVDASRNLQRGEVRRMQKHEYISFPKDDREELTKLIQSYEEQGWELFTITESWVVWGERPQSRNDLHTYTAWMRRPR